MGIYSRIGALVPKPIVQSFKKQLDYVGIKTQEQTLVGFLLSFGLAMSLGVSLNLSVLFRLPLFATFPLCFVLFGIGIFVWLNTIAENKAAFVERILPDVLQLVASNLRAGLTTERALLASARPEFGMFSEELKYASARVLSGERLDEALRDISKRIKSNSLERTTWLMIQGIKSGGEIAGLLSQLSDDLRDENTIKEETKAEVSMYILLIFVAVVLGSPILMSVSSYIVGVLSKQTQSVKIDPEYLQQISQRSPVGRFVGLPSMSITEEFATNFALLALLTSCIFGALTIGIINNGEELAGIKFIPIMLIIALALFYIMRILLNTLLASIGTMA